LIIEIRYDLSIYMIVKFENDIKSNRVWLSLISQRCSRKGLTSWIYPTLTWV